MPHVEKHLSDSTEVGGIVLRARNSFRRIVGIFLGFIAKLFISSLILACPLIGFGSLIFLLSFKILVNLSLIEINASLCKSFFSNSVSSKQETSPSYIYLYSYVVIM